MATRIETARVIADILIEEAGPVIARKIIERIVIETIRNAVTNKSYATTLDHIVMAINNKLTGDTHGPQPR